MRPPPVRPSGGLRGAAPREEEKESLITELITIDIDSVILLQKVIIQQISSVLYFFQINSKRKREREETREERRSDVSWRFGSGNAKGAMGLWDAAFQGARVRRSLMEAYLA